MHKLLLLFLLLLFVPVIVSAQEEMPPDGPYLVYRTPDSLVARIAWPEERRKEYLVWNDSIAKQLPTFPSFRPELVNPKRKFRRDPQISFSGVKKVVALSDIHGQYEVAKKLLENFGVIDENQHWIFGKGHLVIVGDVFDRGDEVNQALWLIHNLQLEAEKAGGRVHLLLGNHETMILAGDVRYIHKRYLLTTALLTTPYQDLYGPDTYLGRWLRSLPLTIRINDIVYVHGGLSKSLLREVNTLSKINDIYHDKLIDAIPSLVVAESEKLKVLQGREGPLWYRGYFLDKEFEENDLDKILKKLKATKMVVGHTSFDAVKSYFSGKVIAVDSSIKFGSTGEVLIIEDGHYSRGTLMGERKELFVSEKK
ncbi:metallophosphoesterase [Neolewinella agarilytica]|uniref:Calcineurin-like phosphoesterase n=1 Tax=Neolewinella agarilytica TaxID=478744 RepID=A0A1H8YVT6_9BACT|nr:metallophosphoesterase [Neolewinella agarilytica]SEP56229.1 Calcineurin-like phosphoesterase [Neolewinella agarilytica]